MSFGVMSLSAHEALPLLLQQVILPEGKEETLLWLSLLEKFLLTVPAYRLFANISEEAAHLAYNAMKGTNV